MSHAFTIARRDLLWVRNNPQLLVFIAIQPILFVLLFTYVVGGAISGSSRDHVQFVIPGIVVQTVVFGTVMTGIGLSEDLAKGIVDRFRSLPIARSAVLSGRILADSARTAASVLVTAAVGMLLGFRLGGGPAASLGARPGGRVRHRLRLDRRHHRPDRPQPRDGPVGRVPVDVPADLRQRRLRPGRLDAGLAAAGGPGQPDHRPHRGPAGAHHRRPGHRPGAGSLAWIAGLVLVFAPLAIRQYRRLS